MVRQVIEEVAARGNEASPFAAKVLQEALEHYKPPLAKLAPELDELDRLWRKRESDRKAAIESLPPESELGKLAHEFQIANAKSEAIKQEIRESEGKAQERATELLSQGSGPTVDAEIASIREELGRDRYKAVCAITRKNRLLVYLEPELDSLPAVKPAAMEYALAEEQLKLKLQEVIRSDVELVMKELLRK